MAGGLPNVHKLYIIKWSTNGKGVKNIQNSTHMVYGRPLSVPCQSSINHVDLKGFSQMSILLYVYSVVFKSFLVKWSKGEWGQKCQPTGFYF